MKVKTKEDVIQNLIKNREELKNFGVNRLGLFGSFVTGKVQEESDLDIFVVFENEKKLPKFYGFNLLLRRFI